MCFLNFFSKRLSDRDDIFNYYNIFYIFARIVRIYLKNSNVHEQSKFISKNHEKRGALPSESKPKALTGNLASRM